MKMGFNHLNVSEILAKASAINSKYGNLRFLSDEQKGDAMLQITRLIKEVMHGVSRLVYVAPVQLQRKKLHWTSFLVRKVMMTLVIIVKMISNSIF